MTNTHTFANIVIVSFFIIIYLFLYKFCFKLFSNFTIIYIFITQVYSQLCYWGTSFLCSCMCITCLLFWITHVSPDMSWCSLLFYNLPLWLSLWFGSSCTTVKNAPYSCNAQIYFRLRTENYVTKLSIRCICKIW